MAVLRSDMQREYRVDVETDSTVAQSLQQDMEGLREVVTSLVEFWNGVGPAVQSQALSMDAVKAISLSIVRRARMGLEVEDAIEAGMQQPKPQEDGKAQAEQAKIQAQQQAEQAKAAAAEQAAQREAALEQRKLDMEAASEQRRMEQEAYFEQQRIQAEERAAKNQAMLDAGIERFKALLDSITKVEVAEIGAEASVEAAKNKPEPVGTMK